MKTKKIIVILICTIIVCSNLWADDVSDIKYLMVRTAECVRDFQFTEYLSFHTEDFVSIDYDGKKFTYEDLKLCTKFLDGNDIDSFFQFLFKYTTDNTFNLDKARLAEIKKNPEAVKQYKSFIIMFRQILKKEAVLNINTLKFISVKISGDQAVLIEEHFELKQYEPPSNKIIKVRSTYSLKKKNDQWKISKVVIERLD